MFTSQERPINQHGLFGKPIILVVKIGSTPLQVGGNIVINNFYCGCNCHRPPHGNNSSPSKKKHYGRCLIGWKVQYKHQYLGITMEVGIIMTQTRPL
jgi:hypothetical protein